MYYQGNLAVKQQREAQVAYRTTKRTVKRRKPIPTKEKLLYLFAIGICVVVAGLVIFRYAQIYEINAKINQIEREIQQIENENGALKLEVNKLSNPERLAEKAKLQGLRPSEDEEVMEILGKSQLHTVAMKR